jgi:hypothetical protein
MHLKLEYGSPPSSFAFKFDLRRHSTVAAAVTAAVKIPTIGIGAGDVTSGQVLVYHDLLGFMQHPHHAKAGGV